MARSLRLKALEWMLEPLVRFALRGNNDYREVSHVLKRVFVRTASAELKSGGTKINTNKLSLVTGIHRREVGRLLEEHGDEQSAHLSWLAQLVGKWSTDPEYLTRRGAPKVLRIDGEQGSFRALVESVNRHMSFSSALEELERTATVQRTAKTVRLLRDTLNVSANLERRYELLAKNVQTLITAAEQNISAPSEQKNLHIRTEYDNIEPGAQAEIRDWLIEESKAYHRRIREFLVPYDRDVSPQRAEQQDTKARASVVVGGFSLIEIADGESESEN